MTPEEEYPFNIWPTLTLTHTYTPPRVHTQYTHPYMHAYTHMHAYKHTLTYTYKHAHKHIYTHRPPREYTHADKCAHA